MNLRRLGSALIDPDAAVAICPCPTSRSIAVFIHGRDELITIPDDTPVETVKAFYETPALELANEK